MTSRIVIGVDGGGTGCRVLIKDIETGQTAMAEGGPANVSTDFGGAVANVQAAVELAARKLGVTHAYEAAAHIGLAGVYDDEIAARTKAAFPFRRVSVSDDRAGAVEGFLDGQDGYLVVAGTGMIVGSSKDGQTRFVGGHGFAVSDHGSGAWIGRQVLDLTLRCHDRIRAHSGLTRQILKDFGSDPREIVAFSLASGPAEYAGLARMVIDAGQDGDRHAVAVLNSGAKHIAESLSSLGYTAGARLCLAGGVGPHYVTYLAPAMMRGLVVPEGTALDGALRLAERLRGAS